MAQNNEVETNGKMQISQNDDKLSIRISLAERVFPLKIDRKDEEKIRKAAKRINTKVLSYRQKYTDRDLQDALSMTALQLVFKLIELEQNQDFKPIQEEVDNLNLKLDTYLKKVETK